jgi:hypothetical protein
VGLISAICASAFVVLLAVALWLYMRRKVCVQEHLQELANTEPVLLLLHRLTLPQC